MKWWSPLLTEHGVYLLPFVLKSVPTIGRRMLYRLIVSADELSRLVGAWQVFRESFQDETFAALADAFANRGRSYRRLNASLASLAITVDEYGFRAEKVVKTAFDDQDKQTRSQAADVFRNIKSDEFVRFRGLAESYLLTKAVDGDSWAFFDALGRAECKVDDIVISATEGLLAGIENAGSQVGHHAMDLHQVQDLLKKEYTASEANPDLRRRLLDLIDAMLKMELFGVDTIVTAHERS